MELQAAQLQLIRQAMPKVASMVAEKRRVFGDAWVTECVKRGMACEPGWFWAREGALAVGQPWDECADLLAWGDGRQAIVVIRQPEAKG